MNAVVAMAAVGKVEEMVEEMTEAVARAAAEGVARLVVGRAEAKMEGQRMRMSRPVRRAPGRRCS